MDCPLTNRKGGYFDSLSKELDRIYEKVQDKKDEKPAHKLYINDKEIDIPVGEIAAGEIIFSPSDYYPDYAFPIKKDDDDKSCKHDWTTYTGLVESFDYCLKCDKKKGMNE